MDARKHRHTRANKQHLFAPTIMWYTLRKERLWYRKNESLNHLRNDSYETLEVRIKLVNGE